jgi:hypothetical protein
VTEAPRIDTDRLVLRPRRAQDFEAFAAFFASDRARHVGGHGLPRARLWYGFARRLGAVEDRAAARFDPIDVVYRHHYPTREVRA